MPIDIFNESTANARGGTELMALELERRLHPEVLDKFQIIPSRVRSLDPTRKRILWLHDLPGDPESAHLANGGYNQFERLVFVSNWQMQQYIAMYGIPWYKCTVIQNAVNPLEWNQNFEPASADNPIRIIYHTTPHRGLNILLQSFDTLAATHEHIHLDVFSSFGVYGWKERDAQFEHLFEFARNHPKITYHGAVDNETVRSALSQADIFAYPSTWPETSCIALMEAMSSGTLVVHPNYAALYETAANWTWMYQYQDSERDHSNVFTSLLSSAITNVREQWVQDHLHNQREYANTFYNWQIRGVQWNVFLRSLM